MVPLEFHYSVLDSSKERQISKVLSLPVPTITNISSWLSTGVQNENDVTKQQKMLELFS